MNRLDRLWKIACAVVYLTICIIDFIVIPGYILTRAKDTSSYEYYREVNEIFKDNKEAINIVLSDAREVGDWTPFSLRSGGLLHISFGAILTGSIIGRKKEG